MAFISLFKDTEVSLSAKVLFQKTIILVPAHNSFNLELQALPKKLQQELKAL